MLSLNYNNLQYSVVVKNTDLFKEKLPEIPKIKSIVDALRLLFNIPQDRIKIQVAEGERIYKIILQMSNVHKSIIGWFVYIPEQRRLDLYDASNPEIPYIQWSNRKTVFKNYSVLLDLLKLDKLLNKVVILT